MKKDEPKDGGKNNRDAGAKRAKFVRCPGAPKRIRLVAILGHQSEQFRVTNRRREKEITDFCLVGFLAIFIGGQNTSGLK